MDQSPGDSGIYCGTYLPQTFAHPSTVEQIIERVHYLEERFQVADDTSAVTSRLVKLIGDIQIGGKQVHDANVVATMLAYGIPSLLTHNTGDLKRFNTVIEVEGITP